MSLPFFCRNTGSKERIWESDREKYYETVVALMSDKTDGELLLDQLKILTSKESKTENTQYYLQTWPEKNQVKITNFPHPYPQLASLYKEMIRYQRKDGVQLTANLYLPPGYDSSKDGPLPCLVWSYPGEFKSKDAAGQVRGSPNEFPGIGATSPLLWLTRGYFLLLLINNIICIRHVFPFLRFKLWKNPLHTFNLLIKKLKGLFPIHHLQICFFLVHAHTLNVIICRFVILSGPTIPIIGEGDEEANDRYIVYF